MRKLTLAICVGAALSANAFADNNGNNGNQTPNPQSATTENDATLTKSVSVSKELEYQGTVLIGGVIGVNGLGMAVVDNAQSASENATGNSYVENDATISGTSFKGSSGNIGVNDAAGDFNVQANSAALASIDSTFAFGSGDAEIFNTQSGMANGTLNYASTNSATINGESFMGATGNIGVNVAAGANNVQANNMAASAHSGSLGEATVSNVQSSSGNWIVNESVVQDSVETSSVELDVDVGGNYMGRSIIRDGFYPEIWLDDDGVHDSGDEERVGHLDFDNSTPTGDKLAFEESGTMELSGVISGQLPYYIETVTQKTTNTALIAGSSFQNAAGNIGVNMAAGNGNLQSNNLSLTSMTGGNLISEGNN